jgi:hypothetical protein
MLHLIECLSVLNVKLPIFVAQEMANFHAQWNPTDVSIRGLLNQQLNFHQHSVTLKGIVSSVVSIDQMDQETLSTWFLNLPTTIQTSASSTYFYIKDVAGEQILVKYPADLDVSAHDEVSLIGVFTAHGIAVQTQGFLRAKHQEITSPLGEPFIGAVYVENRTKQKIEYIRQSK